MAAMKPIADCDNELSISIDHVRSDLERTYFECQIRGLTQSCKWIGDLLCALDEKPDGSVSTTRSSVPVTPWISIPVEHTSKFLFARSLFDAREYDHCAQILGVCPFLRASDGTKSLRNCHPLICFLYIYSRYMAYERRKANDEVELRRMFESDGSSKPSQVAVTRARKELAALRREIETYVQPDTLNEEQKPESSETPQYDSFVLYVCALIYCRLSMEQVAVKLLVLALRLNPCLWPAWFELSQLIKNREELNALKVPPGSEAWMNYFFEAKVFLKIHESERALSILQRLSDSGFSASGNLQAEIALAYDGLRDMAMAATQFKQLFTTFPCRLDNVDAYSNVLFVREESADLAYLAHHCVELDKYRPETCCVVGNFFSLRGQHDKAVLYFQRALKLRPSYSLVWTLVGHEYTELRNTNAAVHAYRQAIAHNRHDFRAWYGLGQMYEILDLPSFALYYYRQAQYLAPTDSRLIVALGEIYERLNRVDEAKKCYWRAYCVGDIEGSALVRLAQCFVQCNEDAEAAAAYTEFIKLCEHNGVHSQAELAKAYNYLAAYHLFMGHFEDATAAANKCLEFPETREEAKAMFRQISSWAADAGLVRADGLSDDPSSTANDLSDDAVMDSSRKDTLWDDVQPRPRSCSEDTSVTPLPSDRSDAPIAGVEPQSFTGSRNQASERTETKPLDYPVGALLALLGFSETTGNTNLSTAEDPASSQQPAALVTPTVPASGSPVYPHVSRALRFQRSRVLDDSLSRLPQIDLSTGDRSSPGPSAATAPNDQAASEPDAIPIEASSTRSRAGSQVVSGLSEDTEESMRLSDAD